MDLNAAQVLEQACGSLVVAQSRVGHVLAIVRGHEPQLIGVLLEQRPLVRRLLVAVDDHTVELAPLELDPGRLVELRMFREAHSGGHALPRGEAHAWG